MLTQKTTERIPTGLECEELMARYRMLPNIIEHSRQVMRVAMAITDSLHQDVDINRDLVMAAALLHDITKTRSLKTKEKHAASGGILLRELGFPSIAEIVEQHVIMDRLHPEGKIEEKEIVFYADKRVMHSAIVSLDERVEDLIKRYGTTQEIRDQIMRNKEQAIWVEKKIERLMRVDMHTALQHLHRDDLFCADRSAGIDDTEILRPAAQKTAP